MGFGSCSYVVDFKLSLKEVSWAFIVLASYFYNFDRERLGGPGAFIL
jgi:hypothetical protein